MIEIAKKAAVEAGDYLMSNFGKFVKIIEKSDRNLATDLDTAAEKIIVDILKKEFSSHDILGEENSRVENQSDYLWIVDPLDGTHNYIRGINLFGVSIGLWHKNEFILGVIYMPRDKELYYAEKGKGAFKNGKAIKVSGCTDIRKASGSFDSSIRYSPEVMLKTLGNIAQECFNIRMLGTSVRLLTYVAEGKLDFAIEFHDRPWDFAGAVCIIKEAGGVFCGLNGNPPNPETTGYLTAPESIYPQIKKVIRRTR